MSVNKFTCIIKMNWTITILSTKHIKTRNSLNTRQKALRTLTLRTAFNSDFLVVNWIKN